MADQLLENEDAVLLPDDGAREANIGEVAKMPTLLEALHSWEKLIAAEKPSDQPTPFNKLHMVPDGRISRGNGPLRMTYRVFGGLLRDYCAPPKNVARCLHRLTAGDPGDAAAKIHTPRSFAYNDYLNRGATATGSKEVWLRTRELPGADGERRKVIVGQVTPTHSRAGSDDPVFIEKLREAFKGELKAVRARAFRGIEVSELRAVIPALRVEMAPGEWWSGYLIVRNSEVGAASWMIGAGLTKEMDEQSLDAARRLGFEGTASLSVQANTKIGVHTGKKVAERVDEALIEARAMLDTLVDQARNLAEATTKLTVEQVVEKLAKALRSAGGSELVQDRLLGGLAMQGVEWSRSTTPYTLPSEEQVQTHDVVSFLGQAMRVVANRAQSYPLERLAGRVLLHGIDVALKNVEKVSDVEEDE
jgi:hypothetical protein